MCCKANNLCLLCAFLYRQAFMDHLQHIFWILCVHWNAFLYNYLYLTMCTVQYEIVGAI